MFGAQERIIHANGLNFHVETIGAGTPLVLIMGLGAAGDKWAKNVAVYQKYFQCILIDNRGAGRSDKPMACAYTTDEMAQDVAAIMDVLQISSAYINGISMGGAVAQKLAIYHPEKVKALVLTSTFGSASASFCRAIETLRDSKELLAPAAFRQLNQWISYAQVFQNKHAAALDEMAKTDAEYPYPMPLYAYKAQCNACLSHDAAKDLHKITAPTLVAEGEMDLLVTPEKRRELVEQIPGAWLYLCKDGGHVHQWEQPDAYNAITLGFLLEQENRENQF